MTVQFALGLPHRQRSLARPLGAAMARRVERAPQAADDHPAHQRRITEADLGLGGMDVDVDLIGRNLEKQRHHRMPITREHLGIGPPHCADEQPVLHRPAVDEEILVIRHATIEGRQPGDAAEHQSLALEIDPDAVLRERAVGQRGDALGPGLAALHPERTPSVMLQRKGDVGPRHCEALHHVDARGIFCARRAQEFAACGHAREQPLDTHARAGRQRSGALRHHFAIVDGARPAFLPAHSAFERHPRDTGDRRQRLAAKAQGIDLVDRVVGQLGGRMTFQCKRHFGRRHAAAIVGHFDQIGAARGEADHDPRRARVYGVFHQFFQRAGRAFDHFSRCNPVDKMFGETAY